MSKLKERIMLGVATVAIATSLVVRSSYLPQPEGFPPERYMIQCPFLEADTSIREKPVLQEGISEERYSNIIFPEGFYIPSDGS